MAEDRASHTQPGGAEAEEADELDRFKELTRRLVAVPKAEADAARAADRAKPAERR